MAQTKLPPPWLRDESDPVNYSMLDLTSLLDLWGRHRNDLTGAMAANEICRRICDGRITAREVNHGDV